MAVFFATSSTMLAGLFFGWKIGVFVLSVLMFLVAILSAAVWMALDANHQMKHYEEP